MQNPQDSLKHLAQSNPIDAAKEVKKDVRKRYFRSKKRVVRNSLVIANFVVLIGVALFIASSRIPQSPQVSVTNTFAQDSEEISDPLDKISSADIAVNIAQLARLDETTAVANNADSVNTQLEILPADSQVVAKPQIVETGIKSISDVVSYVVVEGDTVTSIAEKYGLSKSTVQWSNDLVTDAVAVGTTLTIPPVDGVVYEVKSGDTVEKLAETYSVDAEKIIAFNDAEISGIVEGEKIVIPGGEVPINVYRRSAPNVSSFRFGAAAIYGYNGYDYGYCTWYASNRRSEVGKPIPANLGNASTWKARSQLAGIPTGATPQKHAVIWTPPRDYYGHVGFVEEVYPDGSVRISEMNTRGWGVRSEKVLTPAQAAGYFYIY